MDDGQKKSLIEAGCALPKKVYVFKLKIFSLSISILLDHYFLKTWNLKKTDQFTVNLDFESNEKLTFCVSLMAAILSPVPVVCSSRISRPKISSRE